MTATQSATREVVIIDAGVSDWKTLTAGISPDIPVILLPEGGNGLAALAAALAEYGVLDALHLVSHGGSGYLQLGDLQLNQNSLPSEADALTAIASHLSADSDLLLYGCSVAGSTSGQAFVADMSTALNGADIAASTDRTGPLSLGGDWDLEFAVGDIETVLPFTVQGMEGIDECLGCVAGGNQSGSTGLCETGLHWEDPPPPADTTPPTVSSINRTSAATTNATSVSYTVTFSESVSEVGTADFALTSSGTANGIISGLTGSGTTYTVTVSTISGNGILRLNLNSSGTGIIDSASNPISGGYTSGQLYTIDTTAPGVSSIAVSGTPAVDATAIDYTVTFAESVTGVNIADFALTTASGSTTGTITGVTGSDNSYTVSVGSITGTGTLRLDLNNISTGITDSAGNAISGGYSSGAVHTATFASNAAPTLDNLNTDSVAWASGGITLDVGANATVADTEIGAGAWTGGGLTVQRVKAGVADGSVNDVFSFGNGVTANASISQSSNSSGTLSESGTQFATWTYTSATGLLAITFDANATTARVQTLVRNIGYANASPYGDATIRFSLSDGTAVTTADAVVTSTSITVDKTDEDSDGDAADGFSLREALARSAVQATVDSIVLDGLTDNTSIALTGSTAMLGAGDKINLFAGKTITIAAASGAGLELGGAATLAVGNSGTLNISAPISGSGSLLKASGAALNLSGSNTYSGATTINNGTVTISGGSTFSDTANLNLVGGTLVLSSNETVGSLSGSGAVTLGANTLTTGGDNTSTTFEGAISGSGGLSKTGSGVMTLSGINTYSGATTVSAGELWLGNGVGTVIADSSAVTVASGATLKVYDDETVGSITGAGSINLNNGILTVGGDNSSTTHSGIISGVGGLTKTGAGALTLSGANSYDGAVNLNSGVLIVGHDTALGSTTAGTSIASGSTLRILNGLSVAENLTISGIGVDAAYGAVKVNTGSATLSGNIALAANAAIGAYVNTDTLTISGAISGGFALSKVGVGTLALSGNNTYTGATTISAGSLSLSGGAAIADTSAVTVASGATMSLIGGNETIGSLAGTGAVSLSYMLTAGGDNTSTSFSGVISSTNTSGIMKTGTGILTLSGTNTYTGATTVSAGELRLSNGSGTVIADSSAVTVNAGATLLAFNNETLGSIAGAGTINLNNGILTVGSDNTSTTFSGVIAQNAAGSLVKTGAGTLTLSGTNTYTGTTTVSAGSLLVNGTHSGTGSVSVQDAGILGGSGSIAGSVSLASGATLSAGSVTAAEDLATGALSLVAGSVLSAQIGGTSAGTEYDQINVTGSVDVTGATLDLSLVNSFSPNGGTFTLIANDASDAIVGTFDTVKIGGSTVTVTNGQFVHSGQVYQISYNGGTGNDLVLAINAAPSFTSNAGGATASISVAENSTAVTTLTATDADSDTVTYSISGGADQARFALNAGVLSFASAPNFESPTDADSNNTYAVDVTASDGRGGTDVQTITVTVTDVDETPSSPPPEPTPTPTEAPTPIQAPSTTTTIDGVAVSSNTNTGTSAVTDPVTGQTQTVTTTTVTTTIPIVPGSRVNTDATTPLADIPLGGSGLGGLHLTVSLPVGVGLQASTTFGSARSGGGASGGLGGGFGGGLIDAIQNNSTQSAGRDSMTGIANSFSQGLPSGTSLVVNTINPSVPPGTGQVNQAIVVSAPQHQGSGQAIGLVINASNLPASATIQLQNVDFAAIIGSVRVTGGEGSQVVTGDGAAQYMVLGADDDILHGGGGDDTVGSRGGNDQLFGDAGNDFVVGGSGDDTLEGGDGNDVLQGGGGDAGNWTFAVDSQGQMHLHYAANDLTLAAIDQADMVLAAPLAQGQRDQRISLLEQDFARLADIALLYHAVTGNRPDAAGLAGLARSHLSIAEIAQLAYDYYQTQAGIQPQALEVQVRALIEQVWGGATTEMVQAGVNYMTQGGSWTEALLYLARQEQGRAGLQNEAGLLQLTTPLVLGELGWGADSGNDRLFGGAGNDLLIGGSGNNLLDGGEGIDLASFVGTLQDYQVGLRETTPGTPDLVIRNSHSGDENTLRNVELARIGDAIYQGQSGQPTLAVGEFKALVDFLQVVGVLELQAMGVPANWL